ncbi:hypothetical protein DINM_003545 [Dirofilaria immitis]|nr:hypothetical protein [Dirofilaria immitis]
MSKKMQAAMLDAWLAMHGDNLYPCREEKERLAKDMSMTYIQVNRWFANRRRKQTKRRKTETESPRSLTTVPSLLSSSSAVVATNRHNALTGLLSQTKVQIGHQNHRLLQSISGCNNHNNNSDNNNSGNITNYCSIFKMRNNSSDNDNSGGNDNDVGNVGDNE